MSVAIDNILADVDAKEIRVTYWGNQPISQRHKVLTGEALAAFIEHCGQHRVVFQHGRWESYSSTSMYICFTVVK